MCLNLSEPFFIEIAIINHCDSSIYYYLIVIILKLLTMQKAKPMRTNTLLNNQESNLFVMQCGALSLNWCHHLTDLICNEFIAIYSIILDNNIWLTNKESLQLVIIISQFVKSRCKVVKSISWCLNVDHLGAIETKSSMDWHIFINLAGWDRICFIQAH